MLRLLHGNEYDVGPLQITSVESALSVPQSTIRLMGTLGPPDFNLGVGVRVDVGSVYCLQHTGSGSEVAVLGEVLRYDPKPDGGGPGEFTGTFPCFSGFVP
jgi:hypothetical protein